MTRQLGENITGQVYDDTTPEVRFRRTLQIARLVYRDRQPMIYHKTQSLTQDQDFKTIEHIALPLSSDAVTVDRVLGAIWLSPRQSSAG